ncbi:MAG: histidine kinase [Bacteroidota bacterium]
MCLLLLSSLHALSAQSFQPYFHNFGHDDGLPSSETYCTIQDEDGYIWIGTDNGIARFNGHEFKIYDSDDGLSDEVVFQLAQDKQGQIWASTYSGRQYLWTKETDGFSPHPNNSEFEERKQQERIFVLTDPDYPDGALFWYSLYNPFKLHTSNGFQNIIDGTRLNGTYAYRSSPAPSFPYVNLRTVTLSNSACPTRDCDTYIFSQEYGIWDKFNLGLINREINHIFPLEEKGNFLAFTDSELLFYRDGILKARNPIALESITSIKPFEASILVACKSGGGLWHLSNWNESGGLKTQRALEQRSLSGINFDRSGGLWISSLDEGVFYSSEPKQVFLQQGILLPDVQVVAVLPLDDHTFFSSFKDGTVRFINESLNTSFMIRDDDKVSSDIFYNQAYSILHDGYQVTKFENSNTQSLVKEKYSVYGEFSINYGYRDIRWFGHPNAHGQQFVYCASENNFGYITFENSNIRHTIFNVNKPEDELNYSCLLKGWAERYWVGTQHGLYQYLPDSDTLVSHNFMHPALDERISDAIYLSNDSSLLFATRGHGVIYCSSDTVFAITEEDGLASNSVRRMYVDKQGVVWIATYSGLSSLDFNPVPQLEISDRPQQEDSISRSFILRTFGRSHGLPSEELLYIQESDNYLWLVSDLGIIKFRPPPIDTNALAPRLEKVYLNGDLVQSNFLIDLPAASNYTLDLHFANLNFRSLGQHVHRYRLTREENWKEIQSNELSFPSLPIGRYTLEIQSRNPDGFWSESLSLPIQVDAPWYKKWWSIGLFVLAISTLTAGLIYRRDRQRAKEQAIQKQISELERSALQAQMNPHFVFNSLNSIQKFVIKQETEAAVNYLSRFARLIRETLHISAVGIHSLEDELRLLNHYLELEQLRFKNEFKYEIKVAEWIVPSNISIPGLLIQPFVENAIKHGLRHHETDGEVIVEFDGDPETLQVRIFDNGKGFDPQKAKSKKHHGIDITRRRLELTQNSFDKQTPLDIALRYDDNGSVCGTVITLFIQTVSLSASQVDIEHDH